MADMRVLAVAAIAWAAAVSAGAGQQTAFRSRLDLVAVDVSVRYPYTPIRGLKAEDFEVLDNGVPQEIVEVSYGSLPIDITLAVDLGFTSSEFASGLRKAVNDLFSSLNDNDRVRVILFNSRVPRATEFTTNAGVIDRALREAKAGGQSPFAEVVGDALASASPTDRRHLVIFVTDGAFRSSAKPETLLDLARRSLATMSIIMTIALPAGGGPVRIGGPPDERTAALNTLVQETGGIISWTSNVDVSRPLRIMVEDFRASYVLYFAPRGVEPTGLHTLQVNVKRPGARVKARRAYVR